MTPKTRLFYAALLIAAFVLGILVPPVRYIGTAAPGDTLPGQNEVPRAENLPSNLARDFVEQPGERVLAQLSGITVSSIDFKAGDNGYYESVTIRYADGAILDYRVLAEPTATPTPTNAPTATPSSTPTITPTTQPQATPTQESTPLPTATPAPTAIPKVCELRAITTIRIRFNPTTSANITGLWIEGETRTFDQFWQPDESGYLWGHHADGWSAVYYWPGFEWLIAGTTEADLCRDVEGWPWNLAPPEPIARNIRSGPHILMGEGASVVLNYAAHISAAKCLPGSYQICLTLKAANPDIYIIARPFTDHLATIWNFDAGQAWKAVKGSIPAGFDALELENESTPEGKYLNDWVQFSIKLAGLVARDTGMQYLAFSFGPGNPPFEVWLQLVPYLEWVAANPLPDGRYHGIAIHASPYATFNRPDMPWVNNAWIAGRIYLARDVLLANTSFDLATWPGMIAVTEAGLSGGYSGDWNAPYNCQEVADAYKTTQEIYTQNGYPHVFIWWNLGRISLWVSDHDCAALMFG